MKPGLETAVPVDAAIEYAGACIAVSAFMQEHFGTRLLRATRAVGYGAHAAAPSGNAILTCARGRCYPTRERWLQFKLLQFCSEQPHFDPVLVVSLWTLRPGFPALRRHPWLELLFAGEDVFHLVPRAPRYVHLRRSLRLAMFPTLAFITRDVPSDDDGTDDLARLSKAATMAEVLVLGAFDEDGYMLLYL